MFRSVCLPCRSLALFINVVSTRAHTQRETKTDHALCRPRLRLPFIWHCVAPEVCYQGKPSLTGGLVFVVSVWKYSSEESLRRRLSALPFFNHEFSFKRQIHTRGRSPSLLLTFLRKISHLGNKSNPLNHLSSLRIPVNASAN